MKTQTKIELLAILMASATACGGGDKPNVSPSNNDTVNNTQQSNNVTTPSTNNNTTPVVTPDGAITLVSPTDEVITNGAVTLVFEVGDDVESLTLLVDGTPGASVTSPYVHELDTASLAEDRHSIGVEYVVDGETRRAEDLLSIVVDRSAPILLGSTPTDGDSAVPNGGPIRLTFSESIDPASLSQLVAEIGGQTGTVSLESDSEVVIDFDWSALLPPYDATLDYSGLQDAAGNSTSGTIQWTAPKYLSASPGDLSMPFWYVADGVEYVIGSRTSAGGQEIVALTSAATDERHTDWIELTSIEVTEVMDLSVAVGNGTAYISTFVNTGAANAQLRLYSLASGATEFRAQGTREYAGLEPRSTSIAVGATQLHIGVATTSGQDLFSISHAGLLVFQTVDAFPVNFTNGIVGTLEVGVSAQDRPVVTFARCGTATTPCTQSEILSYGPDDMGVWLQVAAPLRDTSVANPSCDRLKTVDLLIEGAETYLAVTSQSGCRVGQYVEVAVYHVDQGAWAPLTRGGIADAMGLPAGNYWGRLGVNPAGGLLVAVAASDLVAVGAISGMNVANLGIASEGVDTSAGAFGPAIISHDGVGPVVTTTLGGTAFIMRNN